MKILFADIFPDKQAAVLREAGHDCVFNPELGAEDLAAALGGFEVLVVRSTRVSASTVAAGGALRMIIRAGAGTNTIDKDAAAAAGVHVCNVPGRNALAVAELTLGLILAVDRRIADNVRDLRAGKWNKKKYSAAAGVHGKTIGIVGLGAIGLAVAARARAFGMNISAIYKPRRPAEAQDFLRALGVSYADDMEQLAAAGDILTLHVPQSPQTRKLVDAKLLARMKPGAILINTSRGDVVDEAALIRAMDEKGIRAGLDVYADEPGAGEGEFTSALARHPNVYGTHHIGASTDQAQDAVAEGVLEIIAAFADDGKALHCVNAPLKAAAEARE